jgi:phosphohistidine phosphatase SixA
MRYFIRCAYGITFLILCGTLGCKKDKPLPAPPSPTPPPAITHHVTSPEYEDSLLFVNQRDFSILTDKPADFSSVDTLIQISSAGVINRITSGEVVPIDITWKDNSGEKTRIYALGATDENHDEPYATFHGKSATDAPAAYRQGWKTLQKLPIADQPYAIILRHADADNGRDNSGTDAPAQWWKSCDPAIARQLNERGKARSIELGKIFKDLGYPIQQVLSSEFCRAVNTAQLINAGPSVEIDARINHPEHNTTGKGLFKGMVEILNEQPVDNKMTLMVLHHPANETGAEGYPSFPMVSPFTWTGAFLVSISPENKTLTYQGAVSFAMFKYWRNLKTGAGAWDY